MSILLDNDIQARTAEIGQIELERKLAESFLGMTSARTASEALEMISKWPESPMQIFNEESRNFPTCIDEKGRKFSNPVIITSTPWYYINSDNNSVAFLKHILTTAEKLRTPLLGLAELAEVPPLGIQALNDYSKCMRIMGRLGKIGLAPVVAVVINRDSKLDPRITDWAGGMLNTLGNQGLIVMPTLPEAIKQMQLKLVGQD